MRRHRGFSLIELLTVVALLSIMLAIAVPSFRTFISNYRATSAANDFLQAVIQTRTEAMKRGARMALVPNDALGAPSFTGNWNYGWTIVTIVRGSPPTIGSAVSTHAALDPSTVIVDANTATPPAFLDSTTSQAYVAFDATGSPRLLSATSGSLVGGARLTDSASSTLNVRTVCVGAMGSARVSQGATTCN